MPKTTIIQVVLKHDGEVSDEDLNAAVAATMSEDMPYNDTLQHVEEWETEILPVED